MLYSDAYAEASRIVCVITPEGFEECSQPFESDSGRNEASASVEDVTAFASAFAGYGSLSASSTAYGIESTAVGFASFSDDITISGSIGTGEIQWLLDHPSFDSGVFDWGATLEYSLPTTFTFGTPFTISASVSSCAVDPGIVCKGMGVSFNILGAMIVNSGPTVGPLTITTASGHDYGFFQLSDPVAIPEPSTFFCLGSGLAMAVAIRKRRR